jgi:uncharacterized protein (TIGR03437 family)
LFLLLGGASLAQQVPGVITTIAGVSRGYGGDGGSATAALIALADFQNECDPARFEQISHIAAAADGSVYLADSANQRVRRISPEGLISTFAGTGARPAVNPQTCVAGGPVGDGGLATDALLYFPAGVAAIPGGGLLIADQQNNRIRRIGAGGVITTIAGNGLHSFYAPQIPATASGLDWPSAVAIDAAGLVYFAELHSGRVARINANGVLATVAGTGFPGFNGDAGLAAQMRLNNPTGLAFDGTGDLYIADQGNHRIRRVTPAGMMTTVAGGAAGFAGDGGPATAALLDRPAALAFDRAGNLYVSDMNNHRVRRIDPAGVITTVAGTGSPARGPDGPALASGLFLPSGLAVDANGDLLIVDWGNYRIRKVSFRGEPAVTSGGVVSAASFEGPIAPGSLFSIFGVNLATDSAEAAAIPLPTLLGGATVRVGGEAIPLVFASPGQINAQLPYSTGAGDRELTVTTAAGVSLVERFQVEDAAPGVFVATGTRQAIALNQDGGVNSPENPESRGRVLTVFLTGIGATSPAAETGQSAPFDRLLHAVAQPVVTVGGVEARVLFFGLTPGFAGLAQANIEIPTATAAGPAIALSIRAAGRAGPDVTVAVRE